MVPAIFIFLQRVLSGAVNGAGYSGSVTRLYRVSTFHIFFTFAGCWFFSPNWRGMACACLATIALVFKCAALSPDRWKEHDDLYKALPDWAKDVHFLEFIGTTLPFLAVVSSGNSVALAAFVVYPALIFHKGFVNLGGGQSFFASATDDPTGKTWGLLSLGLKIPRTSTRLRLVLAVASVAAFVAWVLVIGPRLGYIGKTLEIAGFQLFEIRL